MALASSRAACACIHGDSWNSSPPVLKNYVRKHHERGRRTQLGLFVGLISSKLLISVVHPSLEFREIATSFFLYRIYRDSITITYKARTSSDVSDELFSSSAHGGGVREQRERMQGTQQTWLQLALQCGQVNLLAAYVRVRIRRSSGFWVRTGSNSRRLSVKETPATKRYWH